MTEPVFCFPQSPEELRLFLKINIGRLTLHAGYLLGNREDAEDVVQEVIIRAYRIREDLKMVSNPAAYLFRMVSNAALDQLRRRNTREKATIRMKHLSSMKFSEPREDGLIREEERQRVRFLLNKLPKEQAEVIGFRFAADLTFQEIAGIVEAPVTTVKSRFSYGLIKLRSMMKEQKEVTYEM